MNGSFAIQGYLTLFNDTLVVLYKSFLFKISNRFDFDRAKSRSLKVSDYAIENVDITRS